MREQIESLKNQYKFHDEKGKEEIERFSKIFSVVMDEEVAKQVMTQVYKLGHHTGHIAGEKHVKELYEEELRDAE